jgi:peptide chain release factor 1
MKKIRNLISIRRYCFSEIDVVLKSKVREFSQFLQEREAALIWGYIQLDKKNIKLLTEGSNYLDLFSQINDIKQSLSSKMEKDDKEFYENELIEIKSNLDKEKKRMLLAIMKDKFKNPEDEVMTCKIEFRGGVGGEEGFLFAEDLSVCYENYFGLKNYSFRKISDDKSKIIKFIVNGEGAYKRLKCEGGVHKVIRIPKTEVKGRLHSSTMIMVVLPEVPFDFTIEEKDIKFDYMRSQGPGGQHVNKTESACRATHKETGIAVAIQDYREQHKNKMRAIELLREKVYELEFEKKVQEEKKKRKNQMGTGDRSDKIRTYNYQQDRITDHRLNKTVYGIERHLMSDFFYDECIQEILDKDLNLQKQEFFEELEGIFLN